MRNAISLAEAGLIPDWLIRMGIRRLLAKRLSSRRSVDVASFAKALQAGPLAIETQCANTQHYEVDSNFFRFVLGPHLKYSSCLFRSPSTSLEDAETEMLRLTCERAEVANGMHILELGCGWGSLTLWLAKNYPLSQITAVSNSHSQRIFIERVAQERGLANVRIITEDMRFFETKSKFDRIISVEMFEHMRNYSLLFARLARWLAADGKAFVHVFCHKDTPYLFETEGDEDWMGRNFFTGGTMPSLDLFRYFDRDLSISKQWSIDGMHYWRTCEAWLTNADRRRSDILACFERELSRRDAKRVLQRWRMFFMACAELFRFRNGTEWFVAHYLMEHSHAGGRLEPNQEHLGAIQSSA
ncbi:MAG: cyclopropane-fatty-acyl-phospholipid synthase family protein [Pirellulaceae bacterium]